MVFSYRVKCGILIIQDYSVTNTPITFLKILLERKKDTQGRVLEESLHLLVVLQMPTTAGAGWKSKPEAENPVQICMWAAENISTGRWLLSPRKCFSRKLQTGVGAKAECRNSAWKQGILISIVTAKPNANPQTTFSLNKEKRGRLSCTSPVPLLN